MTAPLITGPVLSFLLAIVLGFFFGLFLERGGLGNPHKLVGVFYLRDFAVPKVMFSAILVAAVGLYLLSDLKILDISRIWIVPTYFWPQLAGGLLFGVGFVVSGYCPGTAVAGFASGKIDALATMVGIGAGSLVFAILYPSLEKFHHSGAMEDVTLPMLLQVNHWIVIAFLAAFAAGMFLLMEWHERRGS